MGHRPKGMGKMERSFASMLVACSLSLLIIPFASGDMEEAPDVMLVIEVPYPDISVSYGSAVVSIEGWSSSSGIGAPSLPERTFHIPLGRTSAEVVTYHFTNERRVTLTHGLRVEGGISNGDIDINSDTCSEMEAVEDLGVVWTRGGNYLAIRVRPFKAEGLELYSPSQIRIGIEVDGSVPFRTVTVPEDLPSISEMDVDSISVPIWEEASKQNEVRPGGSYFGSLPPVQMVIVTSSTYNSTLQRLAEWKSMKGVFTRVVETSWIYSRYSGYDNPERIRNYLIDLYDSEELEWVILGGDNDTVPTRHAYVPDGYQDTGSDGSYVATDAYYADLKGSGHTPYDWDGDNDYLYGEYSDDGIDLVSEVYVGRLSASSVSMMAGLVDDIIGYEADPPSGGWTNRSVLAGAYSNYLESSVSNDTTDEADLKEAVRTDFLGGGKFNTYTLYERAGIWPSQQGSNASLTYSNVVGAIDPGAFMVNMAGHGSSTAIYRKIWNSDGNGNGLCDTGETTDISYYSTSASQYNGDRLPLFFTDACNNGDFDRTTCLAEDILRDVGIGAIGSSRVSYYRVHWTKGTDGGTYNQGHDYRFWQQFFNAGDHRPGKSLYLSKSDYISDRTVHSSRAWKNLLQYNLMGDPEVPIWTSAPKTLNVTYPNPIQTPGNVSITVNGPSGGPIQGARVCLMNGTRFYAVSFTNSTGIAKVPIPDIAFNMNLTVTRNDHRVWSREVEVGQDDTPPSITSVTYSGSNTTGDVFSIRAFVHDEAGLNYTCVHHTYSMTQPSTFTNTTMADHGDSFLHTSWHPADETRDLWYRVIARDVRGNMNATGWVRVPISDNDLPEFERDSSDATATTGDRFTFRIEATDNVQLTSLHVNYTLDRIVHYNVSMPGTGTFTYGFDVPDSSQGQLAFRYVAQDSSGNTNVTATQTRDIMDNDLPVLVQDHTQDPPTTGDPFNFSIEATDNIALTAVRIAYQIGTSPAMNVSASFSDHLYGHTVDIPASQEGTLRYRIMIRDEAGNVLWTTWKELVIADDDAPWAFNDLTGADPTTGDAFEVDFEAHDNIGIDHTSVRYSFDGINWAVVNASSSGPHAGKFEAIIQVPDSPGPWIRYVFNATDTSGNSASSKVFEMMIKDNDHPTLVSDLSDHEATTGDLLEFSFIVSDNVAISNATLRWDLGRYGEDGVIMTGPYGSSNGPFGYSILAPSDTIGTLMYSLILEDSSGNIFAPSDGSVEVIDDDPPVISGMIAASNATTGGELDFTFDVLDNIHIDSVSLEYKVGGSEGSVDAWKMLGSYHASIEVPINATGELHYRVRARDLSGNENVSDWASLEVLDDDPPTLVSVEGLDRLFVMTGNTLNFSAEFSDNIAVSDAVATGTMGDRSLDASVERTNGYEFRFSVVIWSDSVGEVSIEVMAYDASGNSVTFRHVLGVRDGERPVARLIGLPSTAMLSQGFQFGIETSDNIGVASSTAYAVLGTENISVEGTDGTFAFLPEVPGVWDVILIVMDAAGNSASCIAKVDVIDDVPPEAPTPTAAVGKKGEPLGLSIAGRGEPGLNYTWMVTSPDGSTILLYGTSPSFVPSRTGIFDVMLTVSDEAGNKDSEAFTIEVTNGEDGDEILPLIIGGSAALVLLAIILIVGIVVARKRVGKDQRKMLGTQTSPGRIEQGKKALEGDDPWG